MSKRVKHCCEQMDFMLQDPKMPLRYSPISRSYSIRLAHSVAVQMMDYCPWCGQILPKRLGDRLVKILKKEYHLDDIGFDIINDLRVPEEFKSDAWWKKRGL